MNDGKRRPYGCPVSGLIDPGPVDTDMMSMLPKKMLRPVETAGSDLIRITDQLSLENSGTFWTFDGSVLPW